MAAVATPETPTAEDRHKAVRRRVLEKVTTQNPFKVDIKPVGPNRFRVNAWKEVGKSGVVNDIRIVESFYHVE